MAERRRYILGLSIAAVGKVNDEVEVDPELWADLIEAGWLMPVDDDGNRVIEG